MRTFLAAFSALLVFTFMTGTADARERKGGFSLGSNVFGVFQGSRSARLERTRRKRARLRARKRQASLRRSKAKRRQVVKRRKAARRSAGRRIVRRSTARRTVKRRKVTRRATTRRAKVSRKASRQFVRQTVRYRSKQKPGTIVVDTKTRHLYYVLKGGKAIRYGVAVGKAGFAWSGVSRVRRKVEWPTWTPPREMIERKPELAEFAGGMPGGPQNPLGARALYLFQGKKDTLYRIHGTNNPASIGRAASSGCIRMRNEDVAHLYARVGMGAKVIVR